jgi:hypothetical protein
MRRSLVLTEESAKHSFRASLPPHVFEVKQTGAAGTARQSEPFWRLTARDVRGFATTYFSTLAAALAFFA